MKVSGVSGRGARPRCLGRDYQAVGALEIWILCILDCKCKCDQKQNLPNPFNMLVWIPTILLLPNQAACVSLLPQLSGPRTALV